MKPKKSGIVDELKEKHKERLDQAQLELKKRRATPSTRFDSHISDVTLFSKWASRSIPPHNVGEALSAAFASDLDLMIQASGIPLWIHGHTHYNVDYKIGATRIYSNQRGYLTRGPATCVSAHVCKGFVSKKRCHHGLWRKHQQ